MNAFVWHNNSIRKHEYKFVTTITIQFGESFQFYLHISVHFWKKKKKKKKITTEKLWDELWEVTEW